MAVCCGSERTTAFCPDCGSQLAGTAKAGLAEHLRKRVKTEQTKLRKWQQYVSTSPAMNQERESDRPAKTEAFKRDIAKWQSWLDWVLAQPG
jgi:hypothetical protein